MAFKASVFLTSVCQLPEKTEWDKYFSPCTVLFKICLLIKIKHLGPTFINFVYLLFKWLLLQFVNHKKGIYELGNNYKLANFT